MNAIWYAIARVAAQDAADLREGNPIRQGAGVAESWLYSVTLQKLDSLSTNSGSYTPTDGG